MRRARPTTATPAASSGNWSFWLVDQIPELHPQNYVSLAGARSRHPVLNPWPGAQIKLMVDIA